MKRLWRLAVLLALFQTAAAHAADSAVTTRTGWFADEKCATSRAADGRTGPPGRSCTPECIRRGVPVVFIDEKTKGLLRLSNPGATRGQECNRVEITGTVNEKARTLRLATVKVLEPYAAKCDVK